MIKQFFLLIFILTVLGAGFFGRSVAANSTTTAIPPIDDTFIVADDPTTNFDTQKLNTARLFSWDGSQSCFSGSYNTLLKLDLSSVPFSIDKARLDLHFDPIIGNDFGLLTDFGFLATSNDDSWDESTVTFNTRPTIDGMLTATNSSFIDGSSFIDDGSNSANDFAAWLASQQSINGGNDLATVMIDFVAPSECSPTIVISLLEIYCDKEGTRCTTPLLTVTDASGTLSALSATAFASAPAAITPNLMRPVALFVTLMLCTVVVVQRQR